MTNREIISQIRESNEFMQYDHIVTDRYLLSLINKFGLTVLRREANNRRFTNTSNIPMSVKCFAMKQVPLAECVDYNSDKTIVRSVYKLPQVEQGYYGYLINIFDIEQGREILATTPKNYINILKRKFKPSNLFFWIQDGYLYIDSPDIEKVRVNAIFTDYAPNLQEIDECIESDCETCPDCFEPLDMSFKFPGYLVSDIVNAVNQELGATHQRYVKDHTDDLSTNP